MARRRRRAKFSRDPIETTITGFSQEGRGIAHINEKATFISSALLDEKVVFVTTSMRGSHAEGTAIEILEASEDRVEPPCKHTDVCGGCSLQHLDPKKQIEFKQQSLMDLFANVGKVEPETIFSPILGDKLGYRRKARLGVKYVAKKDKVLVGFRERDGRFLADIETCVVLHPAVGLILPEIQSMIYDMESRQIIPQIEVMVADDPSEGIEGRPEKPYVALIFRHLKPLPADDIQALKTFAEKHNFLLYLQAKGPDTVQLLWPELSSRQSPQTEGLELSYSHPDYGTKIHFGPHDFFQVNTSINRQMVPRAIELLELNKDDVVLDLFCGLGNFTLPMATLCKQVIGVEGDLTMVKRARDTAKRHGIENTEYAVCNLMNENEEDLKNQPWLKQSYTKVLLDPPRSGAKEILPHIAKLNTQIIVYISCNPASLARDANILVNEFGYKLTGAGVMDMFPHTAHVESIAVFER